VFNDDQIRSVGRYGGPLKNFTIYCMNHGTTKIKRCWFEEEEEQEQGFELQRLDSRRQRTPGYGQAAEEIGAEAKP